MKSNIDLELQLLRGKDIYVGNIKIKPYTLDEITKIGYSLYYNYLQFFCLKPKDFFELDNDELDMIEDYTVYDILMKSGHAKLIENFFLAIQFFLRQKIIDYKDEVIKLEDNNIIDSGIFNDISTIIQLQNGVRSLNEDESEFNPKNKNAEEVAEKIRKAREKINSNKVKNNEKLNLADLISAFSAYNNNISILDVWSLTMYQFNDQFKRIQLISEFDISIRSLLAGAEPDNIQLKHWISKLE